MSRDGYLPPGVEYADLPGNDGEPEIDVDVCPVCSEGALTLIDATNPEGYEAACSDCGSVVLLADSLDEVLEVLVEQEPLWHNEDPDSRREKS